MNKVKRAWAVLALVVFVSGCPDGPPQILRDEKNTAAEAADYLSKVVDEDSAKDALAMADRLMDRWQAIKKRRDNFLKMADGLELLTFSRLQDPRELAGMAVKFDARTPEEIKAKILEAVKKLNETASFDYKNEITASASRLSSDKQRVAMLPINDPKVRADLLQFEGKIFGGGLKVPESPIKPGDKVLTTIYKIDFEAGGIPTLFLYIGLGLIGGVGGLGVLFRLKR